MGKFAALLEAVTACDVLHDALCLLMGDLGLPDRAIQLTELWTTGGTAQQSESSRTGVIPFPVADISEAGLPIGWTGGVDAAKTIE